MHFADDIIILKCANERVSIADTLVTCSHKVLLQLGVSRQHNRDATKQNIENQGKSGTNGLGCLLSTSQIGNREADLDVSGLGTIQLDRHMYDRMQEIRLQGGTVGRFW